MQITYSIIIPHKNIPELLTRCIMSIPERDDVQVIVVDDNSLGAADYQSKYAVLNQSNVELILTHEGKGAGFARNVGFQQAKGKWILFVDADDVVDSNLLNSLDKYKDSDFQFVLFKTQCRMTEDLSKVGYRQYMCDKWNSGIDNALNNNGDKYELLSDCDVPWGKMVRTSFLRNNGITFEETPVSNDVMWSTRVLVHLKKDDIGLSNDIIYTLTEREGSLYKKQNIDAYCCRFGVFHRKYKLLKQSELASYASFNYPVWFFGAQKMGTKSLVKFISNVCKSTNFIPAVYSIERTLSLSKPYLFMLVLVLQSLKNHK